MKRTKTIYNEQYNRLILMLSHERKRLGLSQAEVSQQMNMTQSDISKIETGERRIDVLEFKKLLKIYRVSENIKLNNFIVNFLELEK